MRVSARAKRLETWTGIAALNCLLCARFGTAAARAAPSQPSQFSAPIILRRSPVIALGQDTLKTRRTLDVNGKSYDYFSLEAAASADLGEIDRLPISL